MARMRFSRREWLASLPPAVAAIACRRPPPYRASDFTVPGRSPVAVLAAAYTSGLTDVIGRGIRELGAQVTARRVFLKPNIVEYEAGTAINTHPLVVASAAEAFLQAGAREVLVGEGPGHRRDTEYLLLSSGLRDHLQDIGVRFVDLNHDDVRLLPLRSRFTGLDRLYLSSELLASDFIVSVAKLKTHHWAGMTASMKNLFGTVPGAIYGWPKNLLHARGITESIVDLTASVAPHFAIVDGIVGMEGDGPIMGTPRPLGVLVMGSDLVAVDASSARLIGINPSKLDYLATGSRFLGNIDSGRIEQRGESIARFQTRFALLEHLAYLRSDT
jgi:uncharacterized protein (DUF362 family)